MKKILGLFVLTVLFILSQNSYAFKQERNTLSMRKSFSSNQTIKRDVSQLHRYEFSIVPFEWGIPIMPKMTYYSSFAGIALQLGYRPFKKAPLVLQAFVNDADYGNANSYVTHSLLFDNAVTKVDVSYTHSLIQYGLGLKYLFKESVNDSGGFFRPYVEAYLGRAHANTRIEIQDPVRGDGWAGCVPLISLHRNNYAGGIIRTGFGLEWGNYNSFGFFMSIGYMGSFKPFEYMHHKYMDINPHQATDNNHTHSHHHKQSGERDVYADFINIYSSDVHNHKIGEIYYSHLRFIYLNLGLIVYGF